MMHKNLSAFLCLMIFCCQAFSQVMPYPFFDQAEADAEFFRFRSAFIEAVEADDLDFILANTKNNVLNGFGGDGGKEEFVEMWSEIKPNLSRSLRMGGYFSDQAMLDEEIEAEFIVPYTNRFIRMEGDWSESMEWIGIIHVDETPVFSEPGGEVMTSLGRVVVLVNDWYPMVNPDPVNPAWIELELADGDRGYVSASDILSPVDFRCFFEKVDGRWLYAGWAAGL